MKVFLVVVSIWSMAYRGEQETPSLVQEMPSMATCEAVAKAIELRAPRSTADCVPVVE